MPNTTLFDFLYSDHVRVASFLAQLTGSGALKESERSGTKSKTTRRTGGLSLGPIKGGLEGQRDWHQEAREIYDPLWSNSRLLIDEIKERDDGVRVGPPLIGQLRIFSGSLLCFDYSLVTGVLSAEAVEDLIAAGVENDDSQHKKHTAQFRQEKKRLASVIRGFLQSMPLGIGFVLVTPECHFWFNVKREYLTLQDLDIPLKFPVHISGNWEVLGIVDALPNDHVEGIQHVIDRSIDGLLPPMAVHFFQLIGTITGQFGRPVQAWGLNPLSVFRDISIPSPKKIATAGQAKGVSDE
jgi:hypothetical protein